MGETMNHNVCVECKESEDAIWIETPWNKKPDGSVPEERRFAKYYLNGVRKRY